MVADSLLSAAHLIAASGPVTTFGEGAATSIGAGVFLGSFVAGVVGLALGHKQAWRDQAVVNGGYVGGGTMVVALAGEWIMR